MLCTDIQFSTQLPEKFMAAVPFDTLKMVERFEGAGFSMAQAKVQAAVLAEVISAEDSSIAERFSSKQDVSQELVAIKASLDTINAKIDKSAAEVKGELIRWVVSVGLLQMALIAGLVLKLVR
jgi:hypothetical protein